MPGVGETKKHLKITKSKKPSSKAAVKRKRKSKKKKRTKKKFTFDITSFKLERLSPKVWNLTPILPDNLREITFKLSITPDLRTGKPKYEIVYYDCQVIPDDFDSDLRVFSVTIPETGRTLLVDPRKTQARPPFRALDPVTNRESLILPPLFVYHDLDSGRNFLLNMDQFEEGMLEFKDASTGENFIADLTKRVDPLLKDKGSAGVERSKWLGLIQSRSHYVIQSGETGHVRIINCNGLDITEEYDTIYDSSTNTTYLIDYIDDEEENSSMEDGRGKSAPSKVLLAIPGQVELQLSYIGSGYEASNDEGRESEFVPVSFITGRSPRSTIVNVQREFVNRSFQSAVNTGASKGTFVHDKRRNMNKIGGNRKVNADNVKISSPNQKGRHKLKKICVCDGSKKKHKIHLPNLKPMQVEKSPSLMLTPSVEKLMAESSSTPRSENTEAKFDMTSSDSNPESTQLATLVENSNLCLSEVLKPRPAETLEKNSTLIFEGDLTPEVECFLGLKLVEGRHIVEKVQQNKEPVDRPVTLRVLVELLETYLELIMSCMNEKLRRQYEYVAAIRKQKIRRLQTFKRELLCDNLVDMDTFERTMLAKLDRENEHLVFNINKLYSYETDNLTNSFKQMLTEHCKPVIRFLNVPCYRSFRQLVMKLLQRNFLAESKELRKHILLHLKKERKYFFHPKVDLFTLMPHLPTLEPSELLTWVKEQHNT